jgi:hypothetical protein
MATHKTIRVESTQIRSVDEQGHNHSQNDCQTSETFQSWFIELPYALGAGSVHLLLDSYTAHMINDAKSNCGEAWNDSAVHCSRSH